MNFPMIRYVLSAVLRVEGLLFALPLITAAVYREWAVAPVYLVLLVGCVAVGQLFSKKPKDMALYQKDGYVIVAFAWILLSLVGALPFVLTGEIRGYIDALFEITSGFTTTGSSILKHVEVLTHASLFWRSFSHWIGGMGVLVFILMLMPGEGGTHMNLMRAESPGPNVSKFVPHVRGTAAILYKLYIGITGVQIVLLLLFGMPLFDTLCITFGTAGTGGFGILSASCADYTAAQQWIVAIFMILFGMNFSFYYLIFYQRKVRPAFRMQEIRGYLAVIGAAIVFITAQLMRQTDFYRHFLDALRAATFQVGSIITTTGYSTANFDLWPAASKWILVLLMFIGACAGSTGGGIKVSRVIILLKTIKKELFTLTHPRAVRKTMFDGHVVPHEVLRAINVFLAAYLMIFFLSVFAISLDGFSLETNFTAVAATINNIGPGLAGVGPAKNFAAFSAFSKLVLTFDMLVGRLELFPVLMLFMPATWRKS